MKKKKSGKRQAAESSSSSSNEPKSKKSRSIGDPQSSTLDDPVLVQYIDYNNADQPIPSIPLNPDLDTLFYPMKASTFLEHSLRQRAVHITCRKGFEERHSSTRVAEICREMYNLDARSILRETSSDNIFLWLRRRQGDDAAGTANSSHKPTDGGSKTTVGRTKAEDLIQSVEISDVETAIALHKTAGHATYCRAPPKVEQSLVASLIKATGLGCGQYDPSGESMISLARGEVETFISSPGHLTNWHFDFQENFTIQLSGIKRWTIQRGTIRDPIRGCTPHYAAPEAVESQLKAAHLFDRKFRFGHPETGVNATGNVVSIDLKPGDVFYFPAGMWHKVETIVPGVSINVSLMANNYATVVSQAVQHFLLQFPQWRQPVLHNSANNVLQDLNRLLKELPTRLQQLSNAESIIPPALQYAPTFGIDDENSDDDDDENGEKATKQKVQDEGDEEAEEDEESVDDSGEEAQSEADEADEAVTVEEEDEVMDPREVLNYPDSWNAGLQANEEVVFQRNPLAMLHRMDEITSFYTNGKKHGSIGEEDLLQGAGVLFVLNVNYAGNDMHQSAVRVVFCDSEYGFVNKLYKKLEDKNTAGADNAPTTPPSSPSQEIQLVVSPRELPFAKFLIFHGYISRKETKS